MSSNREALLFWVEQEPVECSADIYMPPDTPIQHQLPKVAYQIKKKQELKKQRAIERLKVYHYEQLEELRERLSKAVFANKLPEYKPKDFMEYIPADTYLQDNLQDIITLIQDIDSNAILNDENSNSTPTWTEEEIEERKLKQKFKQDYKIAVEESFTAQENEVRLQFFSLLEELKHNKENEQPYVSTIDPLPSCNNNTTTTT